MIQIVDLTKEFGDLRAVDNLSFTLEAGQTMALIGTSGCGKTTTLRMLNRLIEPTSGKIFINGKDVLHQPPERMRRGIGYVIQDMGLFPHYTIAENISVVPKMLKQDPDTIRKRVHSLMDRLKLPPDTYAHMYPHQLSGGQQQRVGLARALAGDPPIILMDEPFGALDPITRRDIRKDFRELEEFSSKTTIIVTHDILEAFEMANFICVLDKGKVQQIGTAKDLLFHPANDFIRNFLSGKLLELEFHVITLQDIFENLPDQSFSDHLQRQEIPADTPMIQALSQMIKWSHGAYIGTTTLKGQTRQFDLSTLINQFHLTVNP